MGRVHKILTFREGYIAQKIVREGSEGVHRIRTGSKGRIDSILTDTEVVHRIQTERVGYKHTDR